MNLAELPSTFYRVTTRALIFDDADRLLVCVNSDGHYEIPGGGLEYGETVKRCLQRELAEELRAELTSVGPIVFVYSMRSAYGNAPVLRIGMHVAIRSGELHPDDTIVSYRYVTREEFMKLDFTVSEGNIVDFADVIWR